MKNNISFRAEIIEKGNTDFIFLYACDGGVNEYPGCLRGES